MGVSYSYKKFFDDEGWGQRLGGGLLPLAKKKSFCFRGVSYSCYGLCWGLWLAGVGAIAALEGSINYPRANKGWEKDVVKRRGMLCDIGVHSDLNNTRNINKRRVSKTREVMAGGDIRRRVVSVLRHT